MVSVKLLAVYALLLLAVIAPSYARLYLFDDGVSNDDKRPSRVAQKDALNITLNAYENNDKNSSLEYDQVTFSPSPQYVLRSSFKTLPQSWIHVLSPDTFKPKPRKESEKTVQQVPDYESEIVRLDDGNLYVTVREKINKNQTQNSEDSKSSIDRSNRQVKQNYPYHRQNLSGGSKVVRVSPTRHQNPSHHRASHPKRKPGHIPLYRKPSSTATKTHEHRIPQSSAYGSSSEHQQTSVAHSPYSQQNGGFVPSQNSWRGTSSPYASSAQHVSPTHTSYSDSSSISSPYAAGSSSFTPIAVSYDDSYNSKYGSSKYSSSISSYDPAPSGPQSVPKASGSSSVYVHDEPAKGKSPPHGPVYSYVKTNPHGHFKWGVRY